MTQETPNDATLFLTFYKNVLQPSMAECIDALESGRTGLVAAIEKTLVLSCAIDYIAPIWIANVLKNDGTKYKKYEVAKALDEHFSITGVHFLNYKYRLVCGVANGVKHRILTGDPGLDEQFGHIDISTLQEKDGSVFFVTNNHSFDYWRVVLRPICEAMLMLDPENEDEVVSFLTEEYETANYDDFEDANDPTTAIDRMIDACHPRCLDCGEDGDDCLCSDYRYDDKQGDFQSDLNPMFDFDTTMSQISGAYKKD